MMAIPQTKIYPSVLLHRVVISYLFLPRSFFTQIYPITSSLNLISLLKLTVWLRQMLRGKLLPITLEKRQLTNKRLTTFEDSFLLFYSAASDCNKRLKPLQFSGLYVNFSICLRPTWKQMAFLHSCFILLPICLYSNLNQNCSEYIFITQRVMDQGDKEFISEEVMKIMDDSVNNLFGIREEHAEKEVKAIYQKQKANANINNLIDFVIRGLCKLNKPFKYCVNGVLMQNNGCGLNTCTLAYNDPNNDGVVTLQREVGENIVVLTIFAMQI